MRKQPLDFRDKRVQIKTIKQSWVVYILECKDGSLYTGITNNLEKRLANHMEGKGAKYTRGRGPLKIVYNKNFKTKGAALKREFKIKSMSRVEKLGLIDQLPIAFNATASATLIPSTPADKIPPA